MRRSELCYELVLAFQYVDDRYLDIAEQETALRRKRFLGNQAGPMAACIIGLIIILALPIVAIAANWFGLRDLLLPELPSIPPMKDEIGLSGLQGSAEAKALIEWREFLDDYDSDGKILSEIGNANLPEFDKYFHYTVYSQEMADKLEEIVQKYNLKLHTVRMDIEYYELEDYVGGEVLGKDIDISTGYPFLYENGALYFDGDAMYGELGSIPFQFSRNVKGTFDEAALRIGDIDDYQEFRYIAACGEPVVLALSAGKSLIFSDFDKCFILLNILEGSENGITEEVLKEIADEFDFAVLKDVRMPDMEFQKENVSVGYELNYEGSPSGTDGAGAQSAENAGGGQPGGTAGKQNSDIRSGMEERYKAVLLGEEDFIAIDYRDGDRNINIENIKGVVSDEDWVTAEVTKFAVIDLDGNGEDELVLWIQINGPSGTVQYEILFYRDQEVRGFSLPARGFMNLKTDGTFWVSGGVGSSGVCKLQISERGYMAKEVGSGFQDQKPDAEWFDLTEDNVEKVIKD